MAYLAPNQRLGLPNPFRTYSNFVYPRTVRDALIWASYLWERNGRYRTALQKVVSYFIAGVDVTQTTPKEAVDAKAVDSFKDLLTETYDILQLTLDYGIEMTAMGNVFLSAERMFKRELLCPTEGCGWEMRLDHLTNGVDYTWDGAHFKGTCPHCGRRVDYKIKDVKTEDDDGRRIRFVFRSAEDMLVQFNRLTNSYKYYYKIPGDVAAAIKRGDPVYLETTPKAFLDAVAKGDCLIAFPDDTFISARTKTLANMDKLYKGWGLPLFMPAFDTIIQLQHLDKFNEAVVLDYLVPTRIVSPAPQNLHAGIDDPNRMPMSGAAWKNMMSSALRGRITNPTQWIISPVPVQEQQVGGNKDVIPVDLLNYQSSQFLADTGMPQEFRQTDLQLVAPTMGLRSFEKQWVHLGKALGRVVKWASQLIAMAHQFEDMQAKLDMTSFVEDEMNRTIVLQLMQAGLIAKGPVLKRFGIDYEDDLKARIKEQQAEQEALAKQQQEVEGSEMVQSVIPPPGSVGIGQAQANIQAMQQQAQGGAPAEGAPAGAPPPAGGAPMGGPQGMPFNTGASESASIEGLYNQAQELAQQLYNAPPNIRRSQLVQLKSTNPTLHAQVTQMLEDMAQQVGSEAIAQSKMPQG